MTLHELHEEWTDKLSDFLDDELTLEERYAVESHLQGCASCAAVLEELKQVVARARSLEGRPPRADLWPGIAARIDSDHADLRPGTTGMEGAHGRAAADVLPMRPRAARRVSFTLPQLAAASLLIAAMSGGLVWSLRDRSGPASRSVSSAEAPRSISADPSSLEREALAERSASAERSDVVPVALADAQYDAAVSDLERALKQGRGRLDPATITIVEHNLQTIDEAIRQAREALAADPSNTYLSGHLVEARRHKLDLLRRAAALTSESD
jgi:anti-sigma factor RsiW